MTKKIQKKLKRCLLSEFAMKKNSMHQIKLKLRVFIAKCLVHICQQHVGQNTPCVSELQSFRHVFRFLKGRELHMQTIYWIKFAVLFFTPEPHSWTSCYNVSHIRHRLNHIHTSSEINTYQTENQTASAWHTKGRSSHEQYCRQLHQLGKQPSGRSSGKQ